MQSKRLIHSILFISVIIACKKKELPLRHDPLFTELSMDQSRIDFSKYGGTKWPMKTIFWIILIISMVGSGLADFNNDGLIDIYFYREYRAQPALPK